MIQHQVRVIALLASAKDPLRISGERIVEQEQRTVEHFVKYPIPHVVDRIVAQMREVISQKRVAKRSSSHVHAPVLPILEEIMVDIVEVEENISQEPVRNRTVERIADMLVAESHGGPDRGRTFSLWSEGNRESVAAHGTEDPAELHGKADRESGRWSG